MGIKPNELKTQQVAMQTIVEWDEDKNQWLKDTRGVCFEDIENCILNDLLLDVLPHHHPEKYPDQRLLVVKIQGYVYYVPFVENPDKIFLKSIIPSRKLNAKY